MQKISRKVPVYFVEKYPQIFWNFYYFKILKGIILKRKIIFVYNVLLLVNRNNSICMSSLYLVFCFLNNKQTMSHINILLLFVIIYSYNVYTINLVTMTVQWTDFIDMSQFAASLQSSFRTFYNAVLACFWDSPDYRTENSTSPEISGMLQTIDIHE